MIQKILNFIFGIACCLSVVVWFYQSPSLAVVDLGSLVQDMAISLARTYSKGQVPPEKLKALTKNLKDQLQGFAQQKNLLLLSKGSVLGGNVKDVTEAFLKTLEASS